MRKYFLRKLRMKRNSSLRNFFVQLLFFRAKLMRLERKILRFVPQKLRKSFANGNPRRNGRFTEIKSHIYALKQI